MVKNSIFKLASLLIVVLSLSSFIKVADSQQLNITVSNIKSTSGNIRIAVYNGSQKFMGDNYVAAKTEKITQTGEMTIKIDDLHFGEYAISIFHDENSNEILDANFFKVPTEPYGFSNNARGSFGPPSFEDAKIVFNTNQQNIKISLK